MCLSHLRKSDFFLSKLSSSSALSSRLLLRVLFACPKLNRKVLSNVLQGCHVGSGTLLTNTPQKGITMPLGMKNQMELLMERQEQHLSMAYSRFKSTCENSKIKKHKGLGAALVKMHNNTRAHTQTHAYTHRHTPTHACIQIHTNTYTHAHTLVSGPTHHRDWWTCRHTNTCPAPGTSHTPRGLCYCCSFPGAG